MIYMASNLKPAPECISVKLNIFPPDILSKIFVVACPSCGFLLFAATAMLRTGAYVFTAGLRNESQAF